MERRPDPEMSGAEPSGPIDAEGVAEAVAADLRELYGERLRQVILFGSWARGDARPDSDIDLLVVLDRVDSFRQERKFMEDILWHHSLENDTVVSVVAMGEDDLARSDSSLLADVKAEGRVVG